MQTTLERPDHTLDAALAAAEAGAWADAMRLAGSVLAFDPLYAGAFEVISMARRALESTREGGAERRQMTILFADVAGSTALLNQLGGEAYRDFVLELHQAAAKAVSRFGGRIAQYLGDGILAYFSYPQAHEDDAQRAIYAALELMERLEAAAPTLLARFGQKSSLRVGIDTGRVVVGAAGAGQWTTVDSVFGDAPHLAARLQALAPINSILISDATRQLVDRHFILESLGDKQLAGFPQAMGVHRVVGASDGPRPDAASPTMIDRESEAAELEQLWAAVRGGERRELLLEGEAGVGKSRLVEHLANVVSATGGRVVAIHCSEALQHSAFYPAAAALRRLLVGTSQGRLNEDALREALTKTGVPEDLVSRALVPLSSLLDGGRSVNVLPQQLRAAVFELVIELLDRLAGGTALLLAVEDLHRADASTAQLLDLIRQRSTAPILILATQRSGASGQSGWQQTLRLNPLPAEFARALVLRCAPQLEDSKVNEVLNGSAGLPLFLIDAARGIGTGTSLLASPTATSALLTHRLDQLDEDCRAFVADLSVLGIRSAYPLLAAVSELTTERLERALARLLHTGLLVACSTDDGSTFQFRHPLYQELAYDGQLLSSRKRRHSRCADTLMAQDAESGFAPLPEIVAHHLASAGRSAESVRWWLLAGDRAAAAAAHREAISQYERGLEAMASIPASAERTQLELVLQLSHGASCAAVYGYADPRSAQAYTRAAEIAAATPDATVPLPALWGIWAALVVRGEHSQGLDLTKRCLALADATNSNELRAVAGGICGVQYVYVGRWDEAEGELQLATQAAGPAAHIFPQDPALASRILLAVVHWVRGNESAATRELDTALAGAGAINGRQAEFTRAYVFCFAAWLAQLADDSTKALGFAQQALAIAQRNNFETWLGAAALHIAGALTELGDFDNGLPLFTQALAGWQGAGSQLMLPYFLGRYGRALVRAGKTDEGLATLRKALAIGDSNGELFYQSELHRFVAEALAQTGASADASALELAAASRIAAQQGATAFERRSRAASVVLAAPN